MILDGLKIQHSVTRPVQISSIHASICSLISGLSFAANIFLPLAHILHGKADLAADVLGLVQRGNVKVAAVVHRDAGGVAVLSMDFAIRICQKQLPDMKYSVIWRMW